MQNDSIDITPEEARAELAKRGINIGDNSQETYGDSTKVSDPLLHAMANNPIINYILGAQYGTVSPFVPEKQYASGKAFEAGKPLGGALDILGLSGLGMGAGVPAATSNVLASGLYGGLTGGIPGATTGTALGLLGEGISQVPGAQAIGNAFKFIRPKAIVKDIESSLTPDRIKGIKQYGSAMYDNVFGGGVGDMNLYQNETPNIPTTIGSRTFNSYRDLDLEGKKKAFTGGVADMADFFQKNPTIKNAHTLQSTMQDRISGLVSKKIKDDTLPGKENTELYSLLTARHVLKNDINNALTAINPDLADKYKQASLNWANNVEPYKTAALINRNLNKLGKKTPEKVLSAYEKYVIGKTPITEDPSLESIAQSNQGVNKNFGLIPQEISSKLGYLSKALRNRNILQTGVGGAVGYGLAHGNLVGDLSAAVLGSGIPKIARMFSQRYEPSVFETSTVKQRTPILTPELKQALKRTLAQGTLATLMSK